MQPRNLRAKSPTGPAGANFSASGRRLANALRGPQCAAGALVTHLIAASRLIRQQPQTAGAKGIAIWEAGFRPFFLAVAGYAILTVVTWVLVVSGVWTPTSAWPAVSWHAHEMLFGTVGAALGGFLLTAVPKWTDSSGRSGSSLALLFVLWLAGRITMWSPWLTAAWIDLAFIPALGVAIVPSLVAKFRKNGDAKNLVFPALLALMLGGNLFFHRSAWLAATGEEFLTLQALAIRIAIGVIVMIMVMISGRITPAFSKSSWLRQGKELELWSPPRFELVCRACVALSLAAWIGDLATFKLVLWPLAAAMLLLRALGWKPWHALTDPLLWSLHLGHLWLAIGFALQAVTHWGLLGALSASAALHAWTVGAMGTLILAVMTRASLGHTGRKLAASLLHQTSFVCISLAAATRVVLPTLGSSAARWSSVATGVLWCTAFAAFLLAFTTMLVRPRIDGQPG